MEERKRCRSSGKLCYYCEACGMWHLTSMANIDTREASLLIDELYKLAGEYDITLDDGV